MTAGACKSKQVLQFFCAQGLSLLVLNLRFVHSCILESIRDLKSVKDSQELTRSQVGSVTLLLPS